VTRCRHRRGAHGAGHGLETTWSAGLRLGVLNPLDVRACSSRHAHVAGQYVVKANAVIVELLRERGALLPSALPATATRIAWRHKSPVISAHAAVFVRCSATACSLPRAGRSRRAVRGPRWARRASRASREPPDWCISRQRTWGVPIALFCTRKPARRTRALRADRAARSGSSKADRRLVRDRSGGAPGEDAAHYDKVTGHADVWFDSGVTHACVLTRRPELQFPADLYLEARIAPRLVPVSLLTSSGIHAARRTRRADARLHGRQRGHKMSKSLGNVDRAAAVMKTLGADILRLWWPPPTTVPRWAVSDEIFKRTRTPTAASAIPRASCCRTWPASNRPRTRSPARTCCAGPLGGGSRGAAAARDRRGLQLHQFHLIYQKLHNFCVTDLGGFYLDVIKDASTPRAPTAWRAARRRRAVHVLEAMVRWIAPILSFTAERDLALHAGRSQRAGIAQSGTSTSRNSRRRRAGRDFWQLLMQVKARGTRARAPAQRGAVADRWRRNDRLLQRGAGRHARTPGEEPALRVHHLGASVAPSCSAPRRLPRPRFPG